MIVPANVGIRCYSMHVFQSMKFDSRSLLENPVKLFKDIRFLSQKKLLCILFNDCSLQYKSVSLPKVDSSNRKQGKQLLLLTTHSLYLMHVYNKTKYQREL